MKMKVKMKSKIFTTKIQKIEKERGNFMDAFISAHPAITGLICIVIIGAAIVYTITLCKVAGVAGGKNGPEARKRLTPTQKFILAASSPTIAHNYKCVIDIWDTSKSEVGVERAKQLLKWGWGEVTYENVKKSADDCLNRGHNMKFIEYCSGSMSSEEAASKYTDVQRELLEKMKVKYPKQGMLGWDFVRTLSIVGGAYMVGVMEYEEAAKIALVVCRRMQENFSSWDDMVGSYTLGYQFWRGKKKKDRLKYYKSLKRFSWIYKISWDTPLREEEL